MGVELIFEVRDAEEGGYCARALGHGIFTEAETWEELRENVPPIEYPKARMDWHLGAMAQPATRLPLLTGS